MNDDDASRDPLDALLQRCLDERRDPLDDPAIVAFLDADPDRLEAFAAQRALLAALAAPQVRTRHRNRPRTWPWLAAAAAAAFACWPREEARAAPAGRILAASLEEIRPRAGLAADFTVRRVLGTGHASLETFERRSEPR